jgi:hypothetical protein
MIQQLRTTLRQSRVAQLLLVGLLLVGVVFAVPAAAQTLAGDGTDYVQNFEAAEDEYLDYTLNADGTDFSADSTETAYLNVTYQGIEHLAISEDVAGSDTSVTLNESQAALDTLPGAPNENTTVTVNAWGEGADGSVNTSVDTFEVDIEFDQNRSVMYLNDTAASAIDVEEFEPGFLTTYVPFYGDEDQPDTYHVEEERSVVGDNTTVTMHLADSDLETGFDHEADSYSATGEPVLGVTVMVEDEIVPVFNSDLNTDYASDNDTYAVYDDDTVVVELGGEHSDADNVTVHAASHNPVEGDLGSIEDVESAYGDELTVDDLLQEYNRRDMPLRYLSALNPLSILVGTIALVPVAIRRRSTEG